MTRTAWVVPLLVLVLAAPAAADLRLGGRVDTAVCSPANDVELADFDHDGNLDAVVSCTFDNTVRLLRGNGDGTFVVGPPVASGGIQPGFMAADDFNRDGNPDLAVANASSTNVVVFAGDGAGGLTAGPTFVLPGVTLGVVAADLDGNGTRDLAVSAGFPSNTVQALLGNGSGGFAAPVSALTGVAGTRDVVAGDFNGDGRQDLAASADGAGTVVVGLGQAGGGFTPAPDSPLSVAASFPAGIDAGDLDGGGDLDLVTGNGFIPGSITALLGAGTGGFAPAAVYPNVGGERPDFVAVGDLDGDGRDDVAYSNLTVTHVSARLSDARGRLGPLLNAGLGGGPAGIRIADVDRDGARDVVVAAAGVAVVRSLPIVEAGDVDFGTQIVARPGAVVERRVVNRGEAPLRITGVTVTGANAGDFAIADGCTGTVVAPEGSCALGLRFTPGATGARTASVEIVSNAGTDAVALAGAGVAADSGPQGPPGPPGSAGAAGVPRLLLATLTPRLTGRAGRRVTMRYVTTAEGPVTLEVRRGKRRVARVTGTARFGLNAIRWRGSATPGRYVLRLIVATATERRVVSAVLRIRPRGA